MLPATISAVVSFVRIELTEWRNAAGWALVFRPRPVRAVRAAIRRAIAKR